MNLKILNGNVFNASEDVDIKRFKVVIYTALCRLVIPPRLMLEPTQVQPLLGFHCLTPNISPQFNWLAVANALAYNTAVEIITFYGIGLL
jgi:hypothetical protein